MKLYCTTYRKYNAGSLGGAWLDLDRYDGPESFRAACLALHSDERYPELMFTDVETDGADWQDGLYSESSIPADYWQLKREAESNGGEFKASVGVTVTRNEAKNGIEIRFNSRPASDVLANLKSHGWRWSRFGGCWYTRMSAEAEAFAASISGGVQGETEAETPRRPSPVDELARLAKAGLAEYRAWLEADPSRVAKLWKRDIDRHMREIVAAVRLDNGNWLTIGKKSIETRFCAGENDRGQGDDDPQSMASARRRCDWFKSEAGFKIENNVKSDLVHGKNNNTLVDGGDWRDYIDRKSTSYAFQYSRQKCREISDREWVEIRRAWAWAIISHRRRVNAYWSRFGASKLHTWTYWTEA